MQVVVNITVITAVFVVSQRFPEGNDFVKKVFSDFLNHV